MMKLSQAATYFHTTPIVDAYGSFTEFKGRLLPYDDNSRDSLSTDRRILSLASNVAIPARRVIKVGDQCWIVGTKSVDFHGTEELHNKYILHRADELVKVKTFGQALLGAGGQDLWASRLWVKETKEPTESSEMYGSYQIYFSSAEDIRDPAWASGPFSDGRDDNVLVRVEGRWHLVRGTFTTPGGLLVAVTDELPEPVVTQVEYSTSVYDRVLDRKTVTTATVTVINLRWQSNFTYLAVYSEKYEVGDCQILVLKSVVATPSAGDTVRLRGHKYRVVSVFDQAPVWSLHLRHA